MEHYPSTQTPLGLLKAWEPVRSRDSSRVPTGRRAGRESEEALPAAIVAPVGGAEDRR